MISNNLFDFVCSCGTVVRCWDMNTKDVSSSPAEVFLISAII